MSSLNFVEGEGISIQVSEHPGDDAITDVEIASLADPPSPDEVGNPAAAYDPVGLTSDDAGYVYWNTTHDKLRVWNGTGEFTTCWRSSG